MNTATTTARKTGNPRPRAAIGTPIVPQLDPKARLAALRKMYGIWKHRKPDPIRELKHMRKEWDRILPW